MSINKYSLFHTDVFPSNFFYKIREGNTNWNEENTVKIMNLLSVHKGLDCTFKIKLIFLLDLVRPLLKCIPFFTPLPSLLFLVVSCFCAACLREEFGGWGPFYLIADLRVFSVWCMLA